jgi:hypothetical protein
MYQDTVKVLTDHQAEISTALAVIAIAAARTAEPISAEDEEAVIELSAKNQEMLDVMAKYIEEINLKLESEV